MISDLHMCCRPEATYQCKSRFSQYTSIKWRRHSKVFQGFQMLWHHSSQHEASGSWYRVWGLTVVGQFSIKI